MKGLNFNGKNSWIDFGLHVKTTNIPPLPDVTRSTVTVPKLGVVDFGIDTYGEGERTVLLSKRYSGGISGAQDDLAKISAWLYSDGGFHDLSWDANPTRIYKAKVVEKFDASPNASTLQLQVKFVCNPPWPYIDGVLQTPEEISWQTCLKDGNQYLQEFTASGHMRFTNIGSLPVKPKIKLIGNIPSGVNLAYNGTEWQYNAPLQNDSIVIDCAAETVVRGSDGVNLLPNVDSVKDVFFEFSPGQINIDLTATGLTTWPGSLTIIVEFTPLGVG